MSKCKEWNVSIRSWISRWFLSMYIGKRNQSKLICLRLIYFSTVISCKTFYAIWPLSAYYCPLFRYFLLTLLKWHDRMVIKLNPRIMECFKPRFEKTLRYTWKIFAMDTLNDVIGIRNLMNIYRPIPGDI